MNKKNEKKILEELRKRVIEKDRLLQERAEKSNLLNSNKEALAEMTNLSRKDVDKIEKQIRADLQEKVKKANKRRTWIITAAIIVGFIVFRIIIQEINKEPPAPPIPPLHLVETFDNNKNKWDVFSEFESKRDIKNGAYSFVSDRDNWCFWDNIELNLPYAYSIELKSKWKRGKYEEFGLMLMASSDNYHSFNLKADGNASHAIYQKKWTLQNSWKPANFTNKDIITQRIDVVGFGYKYYVNGHLFKEGSLKSLAVKKIGLRICDRQSVDFLNIEVTNTKSGKTLFSDDFEKPSANWDEKQDFEKQSKIELGKYLFTTNEEDQCFWSTSSGSEFRLPIMGESTYTVKVKLTWIKGEESNFGIMFMDDDDNYTAFQVRSSGDARVVRCESDEYTLVPDFTKTGFISDGETSMNLMIKVDHYNYDYFINDKLISSGDFNLKNISYLAMRVCGRQTVAFEEIEIIEE